MLSEFGIAKRAWSRWAAVVLATAFTACIDDSVAPSPEDETKPPAAPRVLGFVELTFDGIGTPEFSSSVISAPTLEALDKLRAQRDRSGDLRDFVAQDLKLPADTPSGGNGTIQLAFDHFNPQTLVGGVRYVSATFNVRNAQTDSTPYNTDRTNLTFLGVSRSSNVNGTAVTRLLLQGGTPAPAALALQVLPTDLVTSPDGQTLVVEHPDVLQILRESEVAPAALPLPAGLTTAFPYGFVVRRGDGNNTTRTLPASPSALEFAGVVDFAFSIPQQPTQDQDPQTISVLLLAVDDSETRLTQGPQEQQDSTDIADLRQLATSLNADTVTLIPGGGLSGPFGLRPLCSVRTAGTAGSPSAFLVHADWTGASFSPNPYATNGSGSHIPATTQIGATFSTAVFGIGPNSFTVRGTQSGPAFSDTTYSGNGTTTIMTPAGSFSAGEEVEITLAGPCPAPRVARYRVAGGGNGNLGSPNTFSGGGSSPGGVALGELTGDGVLDAIVVDTISTAVGLLVGNGQGGFQQPPVPITGTAAPARDVALGDVNGDGLLDIVTSNGDVIINNGPQAQPQFGTPRPHSVGPTPRAVELGDLTGDASLDIVIASSNGIHVLLGNGDGTFQLLPAAPVEHVSPPRDIALGDLDGNGTLDLAIVGDSTGLGGNRPAVVTQLGSADGTFSEHDLVGVPDVSLCCQPGKIALGDIDGNGHLDAVVSAEIDGIISVFLGNGGNVTHHQTITTPFATGVAGIAFGDLDGNGNLDLVASLRSGDNDVRVYHGDGTGDFTFHQAVGDLNPNTSHVVVGDLRGTGVLDAVSASASRGIRVFLGNP